jgi:exosortase/archaeosortase family protein
MNLQKLRILGGLGLLVAAILIWCRDLAWLDHPADTLPLAAGLLLAWRLGGPWKPRDALPRAHSTTSALIAAVLFLVGWIFSSLTLLALAWTLLAWVWTRSFYQIREGRGRLLLLLLLSFPWLALEWPQPGWWLRLSAATVSEGLFHFLHLPVVREGTQLMIAGVPVNIEPACSGWNLLQLSLIAAVAIGAHEIAPRRRFAIFLCLLPLLAWTANLLRILVLSGLALTFEVEVADGAFHTLGGLAAVLAMVLAARLIGSRLAPPATTITRTITPAS